MGSILPADDIGFAELLGKAALGLDVESELDELVARRRSNPWSFGRALELNLWGSTLELVRTAICSEKCSRTRRGSESRPGFAQASLAVARRATIAEWHAK